MRGGRSVDSERSAGPPSLECAASAGGTTAHPTAPAWGNRPRGQPSELRNATGPESLQEPAGHRLRLWSLCTASPLDPPRRLPLQAPAPQLLPALSSITNMGAEGGARAFPETGPPTEVLSPSIDVTHPRTTRTAGSARARASTCCTGSAPVVDRPQHPPDGTCQALALQAYTLDGREMRATSAGPSESRNQSRTAVPQAQADRCGNPASSALTRSVGYQPIAIPDDRSM